MAMPRPEGEHEPTVLLVEDVGSSRKLVANILVNQGLRLVEATTAEQALALLPDLKPDLVLLDVGLPGMSGLDLCSRLRQRPHTATVPVIFLTGNSDWQSLVKAFRVGGNDYVIKPFCPDELRTRVRHHLRLSQTQRELRQSLSDLARVQHAAGSSSHAEWITRSPALQRLLALALRLHESPETPVLIEGETGVGKEVLAQLIHHGEQGVRAPFVAVNVAALARDLFESEVFGYEGGTFTGALQEGRAGKLETAAAGTLFLDEIGELPAALQPKLLRVLEERSFCRVGGNAARPFQARLICATNRSLWAMVNQGLFRADLFHRLNVVYLHVPPLRERPCDIVPLAEHFLKAIAVRRGEAAKQLTGEACAHLAEQPWPGNARQLRNVLESACLLSSAAEIQVTDLAPLGHGGSGPGGAPGVRAAELDVETLRLPEAGLDVEAMVDRLHLLALERSGGNKTQAAALLRVSRMSFRRRLDHLLAARLAATATTAGGDAEPRAT